MYKRQLHVEMADDAVLIGPPAAAESYLLIDRIVEACKKTGAQAVHPGYGFLSGREAFPRALQENGIVFIGPNPGAIAAMGDKAAARQLAAEHGVPTVTGFDASDDDDALRAAARELGVPLLVKAASGGGGRGMRRVDDLADFDAALASARREAIAAFGDGRVLLELSLIHISEPTRPY